MDEKVFGPAKEAQAFVDSYTYMTRMYEVLGPATMDKDPFFTRNPNAPDVSNIHTATAIPVCVAGQVLLPWKLQSPDHLLTTQ
jgi:hypothetical protein